MWEGGYGVILHTVFLLGIIGHVAVLLFALKRGMWRSLPIFCGYAAWALLVDVAVLLAQWLLPAGECVRLYEILLPISCVVHFLVLAEVVLAVWNRHQTTRSQRTDLLPVGMLFAALLALWPISPEFVTDFLPLKAALPGRIEVVLFMLFVASWLVLEGLSKKISLRRDDPALQIVRGFGITSTVSLCVRVAHKTLAVGLGPAFDVLEAVGYLAVLIYWTFCLSRSRPRQDAEA
jgi:hypothetical protein